MTYRFDTFDLRLIHVFVTVCDTGEFQRAAQLLHVTPAAVTNQINKLEKACGRHLFERTREGFRSASQVTSIGARLLPMARQLLKVNDDTRDLFEPKNSKGTLRVRISEDILTTKFVSILSAFRNRYPQIKQSVTKESQPIDDDTQADLWVRRGVLGSFSDGIRVHSEPVVWIARDRHIFSESPLRLAHSGFLQDVMVRTLNSSRLAWDLTLGPSSQLERIVFVQAGLGLTPIALSERPVGAIIAKSDDLPKLPDCEIVVGRCSQESHPPAERMLQYLLSADWS